MSERRLSRGRIIARDPWFAYCTRQDVKEPRNDRESKYHRHTVSEK